MGIIIILFFLINKWGGCGKETSKCKSSIIILYISNEKLVAAGNSKANLISIEQSGESYTSLWHFKGVN